MNNEKSVSHQGSSFIRGILSAFVIALFLLYGFSTQAEEELICPQSVQITVEESGDYKISFEGNLELNERWAWFVCPDKDSAEDLMAVMRDAIADGTPVRGLKFDYMFTLWPTHGTAGIPTVQVPADSGYVFYGKAYCGVYKFDEQQELFMITLGGTNLSKIKPGEIGGNDLEDGGFNPPKTGDSANPFLLAALLTAAVLSLVRLTKRSRKSRAIR